MTFEARKTKFTVFSFKSAFSMKLQSKSALTYTYQNLSGELNYSFLKTCIVLNGLSKSFLHQESIELQTNWAIIMSKRTLRMLSVRQLSIRSHTSKSLPL